LAVWSSDRISIKAPIENKEASTIKPFSGLDPIQTTITFFNESLDSYSTNSQELVGGKDQEWNILEDVSQNHVEQQDPQLDGEDMVKLAYELKNIKRTDFPIFLDPKTATFIEVAIHAKIRQYLADSTIEKNLRYARFMETHPCPIDFRNLTPENFIQHMDYRLELEDPPATAYALENEKKALVMFLRAYGISDNRW